MIYKKTKDETTATTVAAYAIVFAFFGILTALIIVGVIGVQNNRNKQCREQYGETWRYTGGRGVDCVNKETGEGRFFKG